MNMGTMEFCILSAEIKDGLLFDLLVESWSLKNGEHLRVTACVSVSEMSSRWRVDRGGQK